MSGPLPLLNRANRKKVADSSGLRSPSLPLSICPSVCAEDVQVHNGSIPWWPQIASWPSNSATWQLTPLTRACLQPHRVNVRCLPCLPPTAALFPMLIQCVQAAWAAKLLEELAEGPEPSTRLPKAILNSCEALCFTNAQKGR